MGWNMAKCLWGVPDGFTNTDATNAVNAANFAAAVYVNVSAKAGATKQAYTYVTAGTYRICVVGHVHKGGGMAWTVAGNCFIPGWDDWEMSTPAAHIPVIGGLVAGGGFSYQRPVSTPGLTGNCLQQIARRREERSDDNITPRVRWRAAAIRAPVRPAASRWCTRSRS